MTTAAIVGVEVENLDASWLLALAEDAELHERAAVRDKLRLAAQWCVLHPGLDLDAEQLGGDGTPLVEPFAAEPFGAALGISTTGAEALLADALDLQHRLPRIWARVEALEVPPWRARQVARETRLLSKPAAAHVDRVLAPRVGKIGLTLIARAVAAAAAEFDSVQLAADEDNARAGWGVQLWHGLPGGFTGTSTLDATGDTGDLTRFHDLVCKIAHQLLLAGDTDTLDARKAKALGVIADGGHLDTPLVETEAKTKLYLHVTETDLTDDSGDPGVGTVERLGPSTIARIKEWVGHSRVTIQPVLDLGATWAVDRHAPPPRMREQVILRDPHCVFPHCNRDSAASTWTTSGPTTPTAHPARPTPTTSHPCADDTTAPRPTAAGDTAATPTAPTPGPHPTGASTPSRPPDDRSRPHTPPLRCASRSSSGTRTACSRTAAATPADWTWTTSGPTTPAAHRAISTPTTSQALVRPLK